MDQIKKWLIDLYQNHEKLALTLLGIIGGALATKYGPAVFSFVVGLLGKLWRRFGGRLAYNSIQGKYLNWVVLKNQDLNLTGIIGSEQKPRLEQVFISLNVLEDQPMAEGTEGEQEQTDEQVTSLRKAWKHTWANAYQTTKNLISRIIPSSSKLSSSLFQARLCIKLEGVAFWSTI